MALKTSASIPPGAPIATIRASGWSPSQGSPGADDLQDRPQPKHFGDINHPFEAEFGDDAGYLSPGWWCFFVIPVRLFLS